MRLKELEGYLQEVNVFTAPNVSLEQYPTSPHIAARLLHTAETCYGDIDGQVVVDLGCGCGVLGIGAAILNAGLCIGVDIDESALENCQTNIADLDITSIDLLKHDVALLDKDRTIVSLWGSKVDTVIMNPPFGTKNNKGIDMLFLKAALDLADRAVYSLHKTSTRQHIMKKSKEWGVGVDVLAELRFDLPQTFKFHKHQSVDIAVDFIRFQPSG